MLWVGWVRDKRPVWGWGKGFGCEEGEVHVEADQPWWDPAASR